MKIVSFFLFTVYLHLSCTFSKVYYYQYRINIQEINCNTQELRYITKNLYVSCLEGLFEYDYKMNTKVIAGNNGQISQKTSNDSVSMSFIPKSKLIYYQFDLKGNFIFSDSIKKKTTDFIKISPENKEEDPLYKELNKIKEADLFDSTFNGVNYKVYSLPTNFKDTSGDEIATQLFFVKNNSLITPFNVSGRYSSPFKDLCFAGFSYHLLSANAKLVTVISDFKPATKEQEELCRLIKKTLK